MSSLSYQPFVWQAAAEHAFGYLSHLLDGVAAADILPGGELGHVALDVLLADVVVGAVVTPLEIGPETLDSVGVDLAPDILAFGVIDAAVDVSVFRQVGVKGAGVGVNGRALFDILADKASDFRFVGIHDLRSDLAASLNNADNGDFVGRSGAGLFVGVLVVFLAADISLVDFDRAVQPVVQLPGLADALAQIPAGFLSNAQLAGQASRGSALNAGSGDIDGGQPLLVIKLGLGHNRLGTDAEVLATVLAAVRHDRVADQADAVAVAVGAAGIGAPAPSLELPPGGFVVRVHLHELEDADLDPLHTYHCRG